MRVVRIALEAVLVFFLIAVLLVIGSPETTVVEKLAFAAVGGGLIWIAVHVRHLGEPHGPL